jgi:transposase
MRTAISPAQVAAIKLTEGVSTRALAAQLGVSKSSVHRIQHQVEAISVRNGMVVIEKVS